MHRIVPLVALALLLVVASGSPPVAAQAPQPPGPSGGWQLVFSDEFDGTALDLSKWMPCRPPGNAGLMIYGPEPYTEGCHVTAINKHLHWYRPQNVEVSGGLLHIWAKKEQYCGSDGVCRPYTSGAISTSDITSKAPMFSVAPPYYIEYRAKVPAGKGFWPVLWTMPTDHDANPWAVGGELDVLEVRGSDPRWSVHSWHYGSFAGDNQYDSRRVRVNFATAFHTVGALRTTSGVRFFIDGQEVWSTNHGMTATPHYVIAQLNVAGGVFESAPDASTVFPSELQVDYIRVWVPS